VASGQTLDPRLREDDRLLKVDPRPR
jgi:hypothetical protein